MRLLGYMVAHNEAHRYLEACLSWTMQFLDGLAFFDDNSTDETTAIAAAHGANVRLRDSSPSFLQNEGEFRQAAWTWFEEALSPEPGDWVLALDADEFLVSPGDIRGVLEHQIAQAVEQGAISVRIPVPEIFSVTEGSLLLDPLVRTDGFWGRIRGTRLFQYRRGGVFAKRPMGCGAEPTYVPASRIHDATALFLLHYGYALEEDRRAKYERYTALLDHGHNDRHIQSIVIPPALAPFTAAPHPPVWRGMR